MEEIQPEEYALYNRLREAEALLDATILRKRFDLSDAVNRPLKVLSLLNMCRGLIIVSKDLAITIECYHF